MDLMPDRVEKVLEEWKVLAQQAQIAIASAQEVLANLAKVQEQVQELTSKMLMVVNAILNVKVK